MQAILEIPTSFKLGVMGREPFLRVHKRFALDRPGVYTLEGPNGSGKSMLVRLLTGSLPSVFQHVDVPIILQGKTLRMTSCADAITEGIIAIFQDDSLISSMTVFEHVMLRHGKTRTQDYLSYAWDVVYHHLPSSFRVLGNSTTPRLKKMLERLEPRHVDWRDKTRIRNDALRFLEQNHVRG